MTMETPADPDIVAFMAEMEELVRKHYRLHKHLEPRFYIWPPFEGHPPAMIPWEWESFEEKHAKRRAIQETARMLGSPAVGVVSESWLVFAETPPDLSPEEREKWATDTYRDKTHLDPTRQETAIIAIETRSAQLGSFAKIIRKDPLNERSAIIRLGAWNDMPIEATGDLWTFPDKVKA